MPLSRDQVLDAARNGRLGDLRSILLSSIAIGDVHNLEQPMSSGINDTLQEAGITLEEIMAAAVRDMQIRVITACLHVGADANDLRILDAAVATNNLEVYRLLIPAGLNANRGFSYRGGPLTEAVLAKDHALVQFLLENGANPEKVRMSGMTALGAALYHNAGIDIVRRLIDFGADIHTPGLLAKAVYGGEIECAEYILQQGANVDINDMGLRWDFPLGPALHVAAERGDLFFVRFLLEHSADIGARDYNEKTAVERAEEADQEQVVCLITGIISF
jgi:Ankyrin repeats (3 copies)